MTFAIDKLTDKSAGWKLVDSDLALWWRNPYGFYLVTDFKNLKRRLLNPKPKIYLTKKN